VVVREGKKRKERKEKERDRLDERLKGRRHRFLLDPVPVVFMEWKKTMRTIRGGYHRIKIQKKMIVANRETRNKI